MSEKPEVYVDHGVCVGSTMCIQLAGNVFSLNKNMQSQVVDPEGDSIEDIQQAVDNCPVRAINMDIKMQ